MRPFKTRACGWQAGAWQATRRHRWRRGSVPLVDGRHGAPVCDAQSYYSVCTSPDVDNNPQTELTRESRAPLVTGKSCGHTVPLDPQHERMPSLVC
jgi:hypothetical protein